jgi:lipid-A-disaccharide synthase-like uncharacterized protein
MSESWREFLYPLGFISSLAFTARFFIQWLSSEKKQQSIVTPLFWKLSLGGNAFLWIHSIIQFQFHVAFIQTCNAVISWRNLNLIQTSSKPFRLQTVFIFLALGLGLTLLLFGMQMRGENSAFLEAFRIPSWLGQGSKSSIFWGWHWVGFTGLILFNSRFWIQWWLVEKHQKSYLSASFWWMSLAGDLLCLIYFSILGDIVNLIGPAFGLIPYIRNLMLIYKSPKSLPSESSL